MLYEECSGDSSCDINKKPVETESNGNLISTIPKQTSPTGNLLSNVQPPSTLPDFSIWSPSSVVTDIKSHKSPSVSLQMTQPKTVTNISVGLESQEQVDKVVAPMIQAPQSSNQIQQPVGGNEFPTSEFSAAIPPSKSFHSEGPENSQTQNKAGTSGGFMELFKGALSKGVFAKVAEKAKHSVDTIITTLDPQMSEYIYSGGDMEVTVASENEDEVSAIREAFHGCFGKAWVNGVKLNMPPKMSQPIGFENGLKNAEEKIEYSLKYRKTPTIAVENILLKENENWYDLSLLVLKDTEKQITVQTFSQATPVPLAEFLKKIKLDKDLNTLTNEEGLATYIIKLSNWQFAVSGLTRKEVLRLAAKSLVNIYKTKLS